MYKKCGEISLLCENFVEKCDILIKVSNIWRNMMSPSPSYFVSNVNMKKLDESFMTPFCIKFCDWNNTLNFLRRSMDGSSYFPTITHNRNCLLKSVQMKLQGFKIGYTQSIYTNAKWLTCVFLSTSWARFDTIINTNVRMRGGYG